MANVLTADTTNNDSHPASRARLGPDAMELDAQTFKDLEVFESEVEGASLFDLCNFTSNHGGAKALRSRMKQPWSNPARIREVQASLSFIIAQRQTFEQLPSYVTTEVVEGYFYSTLPLVMSENALEFCIGVLELRYGDIRRYSRIQRGVEVTSSLIRTLRRVVGTLESMSPSGELSQILDEMRALLARRGFSRVRDWEARVQSAWMTLRLDQVFRIHEKAAVHRLLRLAYELDALVSMADATRKHGFVFPRVEYGSLSVDADGLVHPLLRNAVANPVGLDQERRMLFLTGPNMAGKTTYLRACAVALYFAHLGMGVPARSFRFVPAQRLFTSITLADNLRSGVSFFRAEALRVKAIAQAVAEGYRVIAFMDEPFKGTNVKDALDASRAILERFAAKEECLFMFSSHLIELYERMGEGGRVDCRHFAAGEHEGRLCFEYVLCPGVSDQRLGMRVLREEGIFELLDMKRDTPEYSP